ncbi:MAG: GNAT family N-acetyltransferase [Clostridiales bacterium]|nr:GNAT family N-acetyltransferase [Clostridiales bacterium]
MMKNFELVQKLKNDSRYCLEFDYILQSSSDAELFDVNGTVCILNSEENYCMVTNYCRDELNNIEDMIRKNMSCDTILINFNVAPDMAEEEIQYLNENHYKLHSDYDSYINCKNSVCENDFTSENHLVELTAHNINGYTYHDCNEKIQYRPSFERLVDVFLCKGNGRIIAYVENNCILGYLSFINMFDDVDDVDYIYVANQYRNRGIGTLLGKYYAEISKKESRTAFWSNATKASAKTAIKSGFEWCCRHISFDKDMNNE